MIEFKVPTISDIETIGKIMFDEEELSCESNFTNLLIWNKMYNTVYYYDEKTLIFRMWEDDSYFFALPYGDITHGIKLIKDFCRENNCEVKIWVAEGGRFERFKELYPNFSQTPMRDSFEYIYTREALSSLSGKKYHSKRNHIAKFSKDYNWQYKSLEDADIPKVRYFADKWYEGTKDEGLITEKKALNFLLSNRELLGVKGGMIMVEEKIVAFTLGSPINNTLFDIHYEKADKDFLTAYAVINREFAKNELMDYKLINREEDLGIEGLRKAKLSYKPKILLEKHVVILKGE